MTVIDYLHTTAPQFPGLVSYRHKQYIFFRMFFNVVDKIQTGKIAFICQCWGI